MTGHRADRDRAGAHACCRFRLDLPFVTNVDTHRPNNLIDSMGTEVIVTDHAIRTPPGRADHLCRGGALGY